jgi:MerR family mercuric resistance operon transcriptional regulator
MRTGELARQAGVNIQTIRFYERERLLAAPPRTAAGYRCYSRQDLEQVTFIKTCQQLGFTLGDIRSLTELHRRLTRAGAAATQARADGSAAAQERSRISEIAQERIRQIDGKIHQLAEMRVHLQALCDSFVRDAEPRCPAARLKNNS